MQYSIPLACYISSTLFSELRPYMENRPKIFKAGGFLIAGELLLLLGITQPWTCSLKTQDDNTTCVHYQPDIEMSPKIIDTS